MKIQSKTLRFITIVGIASMCTAPAHALTLNAIPMSPYQVGFDSMLRLGLTVLAGTNMMRLWAGGSFNAYCYGAETGNIRRARDLSSTMYLKYNQLTVTIPTQLPAFLDMPGFESVDRGRRIDCAFDYEAHAEESTFTISVPGGPSMSVGGEKQSIEDSESFSMREYSTATGEDDACIP